MCKQHGLCTLQVCIARDDGVGVPLCKLDEGRLRFAYVQDGRLDLVAYPQSKRGCDLVVPAAAGVQFTACVTDLFDKFSLDKRMHVLCVRSTPKMI